MVHENDDRAHVPGRPQASGRDIEPLWPPEETDGVVTAPPWATPAAMSWPLPPADTPTPTTQAGGEAGPPRQAVDMDQPFTMDQPPPGPPPTTTAGPAVPGPPPGPPAFGSAPVEPPAFGSAPVVPAAEPAAPGPPLAGPTPSSLPRNTYPSLVEEIPTSASREVSPPEVDEPAAATAGLDDATGNERPASPWAQPPQRATPEALAPQAVPTPDAPALSAAPISGPTPGPGSAVPADGSTTTGEEGAPRLGPFPPSPGVPIQPYAPAPYPTQSGQYPSPGWATQSGRYPAVPTQPASPRHQAHPQASVTPPQPPGPLAQQPAPVTQQPGPVTQQPGPVAQQPGPVAQQPAPVTQGPHPAQEGYPGQVGYPEQGPHPEQGGYPEQGWAPQHAAPPTAEDFARRRQARPVDPVATMGVRAVVNKIGLVRLPPGRHEQELKRDIETVRRNFGGLRQVTVVNPKGGAGKTVAILLLAMTFGQNRGGYVLAWDNNETQGTLGMRAQQDFHARTVRDMLRDLPQFQGSHGRIGDLSQYVRSQGAGMFDVLASDESATGGEMLTAAAFADLRDVVSRFYKLIFVDTGNNVRAQNWQAAMDATDQLVVTMSARNDSAETAARMLDHLEQSGRQRLVRQAVTVVSMPPSRKEIDLPAIQAHFAARTRAVLLAPYERLIDTGEPLRYGQLSSATRDAWLKIAASVAEGL
ncbi:chromosome partitioning protein [Micromonospora sp. DT31]|uniref:MinD/ParA family ATP-binding protein n=1 Tax=Micromonospora sp. DT31 TaxID=3393434 RepID=UPI003CEAE47E